MNAEARVLGDTPGVCCVHRGDRHAVLDGAYLVGTEPPVFRRIEPPRQDELQALVERLAERIGRALERQGVLARDAEESFLELNPETGGPLDDLIGHSITYRVAMGPRVGRKVFSFQTVPVRGEEPRKGVAQYAGFSLHAGIGVAAERRDKLERLTRYVSRPPVWEERLDLTAQGQVRYRLKTPYRPGRGASSAYSASRSSSACCGGRLKVIASIKESELIERILAHRRERGEEGAPRASLGARAPPQGSLL